MNRYTYMETIKTVLPNGYHWCEVADCGGICTKHYKSRTIDGKKWLCEVHHSHMQAVHDLQTPYVSDGLLLRHNFGPR